MTITAAADGSALGNPGPAGWAWYVDDDRWAAGGWPHATNNQGELMAVLDLFRATGHLDDDLHILCDSQYVINCITQWMPSWKRKGWRKGDGKPVLNLDLLKQLDAAIVGRRYRFEWVKGHMGHTLNEAADTRARAAAEAYQRRAAVPTGPGFPGGTSAGSSSLVAPDRAPTLFDDAPAPAPAPAAPSSGAASPAAPSPGAAPALTLSPTQRARLEQRARDAGITLEQALHDLI